MTGRTPHGNESQTPHEYTAPHRRTVGMMLRMAFFAALAVVSLAVAVVLSYADGPAKADRDGEMPWNHELMHDAAMLAVAVMWASILFFFGTWAMFVMGVGR